MDRYEYKMSLKEIRDAVQEKRFDDAARICDDIDWSRVKSVETLCMVGEIYKRVKRYEDSRRILALANSRDPQNSDIVFSLCEITIFLYGRNGSQADFMQAMQLKQTYEAMEPGNPRRLVLQYKLYLVTPVSAEEKIAVLEQLKKEHYTAKYGFELAKEYRSAGRKDDAIAEAQSVIARFGGRYGQRSQQLIADMAYDPSFGTDTDSETKAPKEEEQAPKERTTVEIPTMSGGNFEENVRPSEPEAESPVEQRLREEMAAQDYAKVHESEISELLKKEQAQEDAMKQSAPVQENKEDSVPAQDQDTHIGYHTAPAAGEEEKTAAPAQEESAPSDDAAAPEEEKTAGQAEQPEQQAPSLQVENQGSAAIDPAAAPKETASQRSISEVMQEWERIRNDVRRSNNERRRHELLNDTSEIIAQFDETAKHGIFEDVEREVDAKQRAIRRGDTYIPAGLTYGDNGYMKNTGAIRTGRPQQQVQYEPLDYENQIGYHGGDNMPPEEQGQDEPQDQSYYGQDNGYPEQQEYPEGQDGCYEEQAPEQAPYEEQPVTDENAYEQPYEEMQAAPEEGTEAEQAAPETAEEVPEEAPAEETPAEETEEAPEEGVGPAPARTEQYLAEPDVTSNMPLNFDRSSYEKLPPLDGETPAPEEAPAAEEAPKAEDAGTEQAPAADPAEPHSFGTAAEEEPEEEEVPFEDDHSTRRWNARALRRVMKAQEEQLAAMEAEENAKIAEAARKAKEEDLQTEETKEAKTPEAPIEEVPAGEPLTEEVPAEEAPVEEAPAEEIPAEEASVEEAPAEEAPAEEMPAEEEAPAEEASVEEEPQEEAPEEAPVGEEPAEEVPEEEAPAEEEQPYEEEPEEEQPYEDETGYGEDTYVPVDGQPEQEAAPAEEETPEEEQPVEEEEGTPAPAPVRSQTPKKRRRQVPVDENDARERASLAAPRQKDHELSEEERRLFGPVCVVRENRLQIADALDRVDLASNTGNIIVTGSENTTRRVAKGILEMTKHSDRNFTGKIAKANAAAINHLSAERMHATLDQISNGALLISEATGLKRDTMERLHRELEQENRGLIVILMDNRKAMRDFIKVNEAFLSSFTITVDVKPLNDKALVSYGVEYAMARDYSIDEFGRMALASRIAALQTRDHHVSTREVRDIVDEAIRYASRKSLKTLWAVLTKKRYDADDRIIIREKDFQHYA